MRPTVMEDLSSLVEILIRFGGRIAAVAFCGLFFYQAFDALRSAVLGVQPQASKPDPDPTSTSARFGGLAWGLIAFAIGSYILAGLIFGGDVVLGALFDAVGFAKNQH